MGAAGRRRRGLAALRAQLVLLLLLLLAPKLGAALDETAAIGAAGAGAVVGIGGANASVELQARAFSLVHFHNRYCAGCQLLRRRMAAAAALYADSGAAAPPRGGFAEADAAADPGLLQIFGLRELPALRVFRAADNRSWPYVGGLDAAAMAAHLVRLVRAEAAQPLPIRTVSDIAALGHAANSVALVLPGTPAPDARALGLLRRVADAPAVRALEPTGLRVGAVVTPQARRHLAMATPRSPVNATPAAVLSLVAVRRSTTEWKRWDGGWPGVTELAEWVAGYGAPALTRLTPRVLSDQLLEDARSSSVSLLVACGGAADLEPGAALHEALLRAATVYSGSLRVGYLDVEAWPELALRLRGSRQQHALLVIDVRDGVVLAPALAAEPSSAWSWLRVQRFCDTFVQGKLRPLVELPFDSPCAGRRCGREQEERLWASWAGLDRGLRDEGVTRLFARDFGGAAQSPSGTAGNASVPTLVAFLLPWCGFSVQVEPVLEEVSAVASLASLPFNVGRYDVTPTNSLPDHLLSK